MDRIYEIFNRLRSCNPNPTSELVAKNEYTFCVAVLLSAQTTDKAVNSATKSLFEIADTPTKMLALGVEKLSKYIKTLGLYNNKARNIVLLSEILVNKYHSHIPENRGELEKLPGIGRKSANVILNRLFKMEFIAVDTHVLRVSKRLALTKSHTPLAVENDLMQAIPKEFHKNASDWLVLHGRYICTAKTPNCLNCLLEDLCEKQV
ncbi:MAG: endonuclease III [Holosporales bacterium]|nr:endonuclease III [Holosporales bacterium]